MIPRSIKSAVSEGGRPLPDLARAYAITHTPNATATDSPIDIKIPVRVGGPNPGLVITNNL